MSTLVMTDGTAASSKAIELAGYAGGPLLHSHNGAQLIIVHAWHRSLVGTLGPEAAQSIEGNSAVATSVTAAAGASGNAGGMANASGIGRISLAAALPGGGGGGGGGISPLAAASTGSAPHASLTVEAALRAVALTASSSPENLMAAMETRLMGSAGTATTAATAIATSMDTGGDGKAQTSSPATAVAAPSVRLSEQLPAVFVVQRALQTIHESKTLRDQLNYKLETSALVLGESLYAVTGAGNADEVPVSPRASGNAPGRPKPTASGRMAQQQRPTRSLSVEKDATAPAVMRDEAATIEELRNHRAKLIVSYSASRAAHHGVHAIALGVGTTQEGKTITIGSVAREALRTLKDSYLLCYVKADGITLRPSTAAVRYIVVALVDDTPVGGEAAAIETALEKVPTHLRGLQSACAAVRYALRCCRPDSRDHVTVVLAVERDSGTNLAETAASAIEESADSNNNGLWGGGGASVGTYTACLSRMIQAHAPHAPSPASAALAAEPSGAAAVAPTAMESSGAAEANTESVDATATAAAASAGQEEPIVSVCVLKPTKSCPNPTLVTAAGQVAKFVQQRKADIVVVPSAAPEPVQLALLGMSRPHCLVVPFTSV